MIRLEDISRISEGRANKVALASDEYSLTWGAYEASVRDLIVGLSCLLKGRDVTQAAFISKNRIELVLAMSAFSSIGVPICGIDYTLSPENIVNCLDLIKADCLILSSKHLSREVTKEIIARWRGLIVDLDESLDGSVRWSAVVLSSVSTLLDLRPKSRPLRIVAFTSGTSGDPRPTLRTASSDARRFSYFTTRYGFSSEDRFLLNIPLYHVAGNGWARHFLSLGATIYIAPDRDYKKMADWIVTKEITATVTTPINLQEILGELEESRNLSHLLKFVLVGGKNFSPSQKKHAIDRLGPVVFEYYGSTETGVNTIAEPEDLLSCPESAGRPFCAQKVVALNVRHEILPPNRPGRIAVSGFLLMDSYLDGPANEVVIDTERFLITPDSGYIDSCSRVFLLNRSSGQDSGLDLYSIEERIRRIQEVKDVAIVTDRKAADRADLLRVDCALVLESDRSRSQQRSEAVNCISDNKWKEASRSQATSICDAARAILLEFDLAPRFVKVIDGIPYSLSGKIRRKDLLKRLESVC